MSDWRQQPPPCAARAKVDAVADMTGCQEKPFSTQNCFLEAR